MATLLLYAYSLGMRSSWKIEQLCERDIGFRVVASNHVPDHTTIARFRKEHGAALEGLFIEVLKLCAAAGLLKVGVVALDGTKMKADAALESNRSHEHIESESGRKRRGRKPKGPDFSPSADSKANVTDPDSRIMKTRRGYVQGYNGQAVVTQEQIVVAAELTTQKNDVGRLHPMVEKMEANLAAVQGEKREVVKVVLADAGYCSEANLAAAGPDGPEYVMATRKDWKPRQAQREAPPPRGRIPKGLSRRELMDRKLLTKRGRELYRKQRRTVEPVFGQIKTVRGCDRFMMRGLAACSQEWKLICATHNLL